MKTGLQFSRIEQTLPKLGEKSNIGQWYPKRHQAKSFPKKGKGRGNGLQTTFGTRLSSTKTEQVKMDVSQRKPRTTVK